MRTQQNGYADTTGAGLAVIRRNGALVRTPPLMERPPDRVDVDETLLYAQVSADTRTSVFDDPRQWFEDHSQYLDNTGWEYVKGGSNWDTPKGVLAVDGIIRERFAAIPASTPQMRSLVDRALTRLRRAEADGVSAAAGLGTNGRHSGRGCFYLVHVDYEPKGPLFHMVNFWYDTQEHVTNALFHRVEHVTLLSTSYGIRRLDAREYDLQRERVQRQLHENAEQGVKELDL
ncbi:hypothetical protein [Nocardiopsis sp. LOL_012]|uniref:hypothetical protein n=1 Tax=Nocardiopsis sp. LOL_012 TaxID=3345409 RepID=UPI003A88A49A